MKKILSLIVALLTLSCNNPAQQKKKTGCAAQTDLERSGYKGHVKSVTTSSFGLISFNDSWAPDPEASWYTLTTHFNTDGMESDIRVESKIKDKSLTRNYAVYYGSKKIDNVKVEDSIDNIILVNWQTSRKCLYTYYKSTDEKKKVDMEITINYDTDCVPVSQHTVLYDSAGRISTSDSVNLSTGKNHSALYKQHGALQYIYADDMVITDTDTHGNPLKVRNRSMKAPRAIFFKYEYYQ